jgi:RNA polymerase sigma-70 factor (ECF subfamily)
MDFFTFDEEYVQRLREGDRWTVEHFYSYFQPLLLIKLRRGLRSVDQVEDKCQDVFFRVFRDLRSPGGGLREASKLGAYVLSFCRNVILEEYRKKPRTEIITDIHFDRRSPVDETLIRSEELARVRLVLGELPEKDAAILRARFLEERPADEICEEFGVDGGYLRVLLYRAREKFREAWMKDPEPPEPKGPDETDPDKPSLPN